MNIKKSLLKQGFVSNGDVVLDLRSVVWRICQERDFSPRLSDCQTVMLCATPDKLQETTEKFVRWQAHEKIQVLVVDVLTELFKEIKDPKYKPIIRMLLEGGEDD